MGSFRLSGPGHTLHTKFRLVAALKPGSTKETKRTSLHTKLLPCWQQQCRRESVLPPQIARNSSALVNKGFLSVSGSGNSRFLVVWSRPLLFLDDLDPTGHSKHRHMGL